jgi:hypothetical protein
MVLARSLQNLDPPKVQITTSNQKEIYPLKRQIHGKEPEF